MLLQTLKKFSTEMETVHWLPGGEGAIEAAHTVVTGRKMTIADHPSLHFRYLILTHSYHSGLPCLPAVLDSSPFPSLGGQWEEDQTKRIVICQLGLGGTGRIRGAG